MPPLKHGTSRDVVSSNIHELVKSGRPVNQAVAAALHMKDESAKHKYAEGGIAHYADGTTDAPVSGDTSSLVDQILGGANSSSSSAAQDPASLAAVAESAGLPQVLEQIAAKGGDDAVPAIGKAIASAGSSKDDSDDEDGDEGDGEDEVTPAARAPASATGDEEEEDDQDPSAEPAKVAIKGLSPAEIAAAQAQIPAPAVNPLVAKYLQDKADMQDAQQKSATMRLVAGLARTGALAGTSAYAATRGVDEQGLKQLEENANIPVENQVGLQAAGAKAIQEQQAMMAAQSEQEANDPNSNLSKATRAIYGPILAKAGIPTDPIQGMSANDIKAYAANPIDFMAKLKSAENQKEIALALANKRADMAQGNKNTAVLKGYQDQTNNESKKANEAVAAADEALNGIDMAKTNPVAWSAVPIQLARGFTHGQRISQVELSKLGGDQGSVINKLMQIGQQAATGTVTDANLAYFKQVAQSMKNSAAAERDAIATRHAKQYSQNTGTSVEDAYQKLTGSEMPKQTAAASPAPAVSSSAGNDMVRVISPQGVTGTLPRSKLAEAKARGFKEAP